MQGDDSTFGIKDERERQLRAPFYCDATGLQLIRGDAPFTEHFEYAPFCPTRHLCGLNLELLDVDDAADYRGLVRMQRKAQLG